MLERLTRNITLTERQRQIVFEWDWVDGILLVMPTTNPCQDPSSYYKYIDEDSSEFTPLPAIKAKSCEELDLPGVDTLPGYFSVTAAVCFFSTSLQQYEGSVVNGALNEKPAQDPGALLNQLGESRAENQTKECWRCTFLNPCVVDHVIYTNISANLSSVPGGTTVIGNNTVPLRCLYGFTYPWYRALMVAGELWNTISSKDDQTPCTPSGNYTSMSCSSSWWLNDLFNGGNATIFSIDELMKRGFDSLSGQLRMIGTDLDGNPTNISGEAYDTVVCILFRWEWLFYSLSLAVGAMVLLLLLLVSSSGIVGLRREVIWKSSVLTLLFYGAEDQIRDKVSHLEPQRKLDGIAKNLNTRFSSEDDGWRFHT